MNPRRTRLALRTLKMQRGADCDKILPTRLPPADHPLLKLNNVLFSPQLAGMDEQSHHDLVVMVARVLVDLYEGRWPEECIVNLKEVRSWK